MAWKLSRKRYGLCRTAASVLESGAAVCARQRSSAVRALGTEARGWGWGSPGTALHTPARPVVAGELGVPRVTPRAGRGQPWKPGPGSLPRQLCPVSLE